MARPWKIWHKLILGLGLVVCLIALLLGGTLYGMFYYLETVKTVDLKLMELEKIGKLREKINDLATGPWGPGLNEEANEFAQRIALAREALDKYKKQLQHTLDKGRDPDKGHDETTQIEGLTEKFDQLEKAIREVTDFKIGGATEPISRKDPVVKAVNACVSTAGDLQSAISEEMADRISESKTNHTYSMVVVVSTSVVGLILMAGLLRFFYTWVFYPVRDLQQGAKLLGEGRFDQHIEVHSGDEMEDLAVAFNTMTEQLRTIYADLERQVNERSRQLVRSERLASVGFLAAGVAHEINNPLQAITLYSGALDARMNELARKRPNDAQDFEVLCRYLKTILEEAFRCKRITERLLEFSRGGDSPRQQVELADLVESVIEVARPLQSAQGKRIAFANPGPVWAWVNGDEIKSVVLNLVVNALDSMDAGGTLTILMAARNGQAELTFHDTGCGMEADVLENIFEPFFTRSRGGKGTGLGLTISHAIITQHGGEISAASPGPDQGSSFTVRLPMQTEAALDAPRLAA